MTAEDQTNTQIINGTEYRYSSEWIYSLESETHWRLYWQQQKVMQDRVKPGDHVLEIGVGSGFTANYLRTKDVTVTTIDIDPEKNSDIVANIVEYPFSEEYDHILAYEVFEHIPFSEFEYVLPRIRRACRQFLFLSVPQGEVAWFRFELHLPKFRPVVFQFTTRKPRFLMTPHHHWELGSGDVNRTRFKKSIQDSGFHIAQKEKVFSRWFFTLE